MEWPGTDVEFDDEWAEYDIQCCLRDGEAQRLQALRDSMERAQTLLETVERLEADAFGNPEGALGVSWTWSNGGRRRHRVGGASKC